MTREQFLLLPEDLMNLFISKLIHAIKHDNTCFQYADYIVGSADQTGLYKDVKFGDDVINELQFDERIVHPTRGVLFFNHKNENNMNTDPKEKDAQEELGPDAAVANDQAGNEEQGGEGEGEE